MTTQATGTIHPMDPETYMLTCDGCGASVRLPTAVIFHKDLAGIRIGGYRRKPVDRFIGLCVPCTAKHGDELHTDGYAVVATRRFLSWSR